MNQLTGSEEFTLDGKSSGISISEFWQWAYSDLLNNTYRGVLAEFLVYRSMQTKSTPTPGKSDMRTDWTPYDLISSSGRRIEVKSAAYLQSWEHDYYSKLIFSIAPSRAWHPSTGYSPEKKRNSDLYVFCVFTATSREQSVLNLDLWDFYVLPTSVIDRCKGDQKTISFSSLLGMNPVKSDFLTLGKIIDSIDLCERT